MVLPAKAQPRLRRRQLFNPACVRLGVPVRRLCSAASDATCPLTTLTIGAALWCPRSVKVRALVLLLLPVSCAATGDSTLSQLRTRASFDLDCPKSQIKTVTIDERTRGVKGCGQRATYVHQCEPITWNGTTIDEKCTWVLNADSRRRRPARSDDDAEGTSDDSSDSE